MRDVIKAESAAVRVPELDMELGIGTLGGLVTTVEVRLASGSEPERTRATWRTAGHRMRLGIIPLSYSPLFRYSGRDAGCDGAETRLRPMSMLRQRSSSCHLMRRGRTMA